MLEDLLVRFVLVGYHNSGEEHLPVVKRIYLQSLTLVEVPFVCLLFG